MMDKLDEIEIRFSYHPPKEGQPEKYVELRDAAKNLAYIFFRLTPPSRETSLAFTALEQAVFWAIAAIARRE